MITNLDPALFLQSCCTTEKPKGLIVGSLRDVREKASVRRIAERRCNVLVLDSKGSFLELQLMETVKQSFVELLKYRCPELEDCL
jgi:hypothetical protein